MVYGGGSVNANHYLSDGATYAEDGSENGGTGGAGKGRRAQVSWYSRRAGGGAGNPGGKGGENDLGNSDEGTGENGTGGLLIIYANSFENFGKIESNGSKGGNYYQGTGGSTGGGSINIFYNTNIKQNGTIQAIGGEAVATSNKSIFGGKGGDGTISIGTVESKNYVPTKTEIKFQETEKTLIKVLNSEEVKGKNGEKTGDIQEFYASILNDSELKDKKWSTSNSAVATVDENGKIVAVGSGEADITCRAKITEKIEASTTMKVKVQGKLYLYFYGNEFTSITGGYTEAPRTGRRYSATFNTNNIYIDCAASYGGGGICTVNKINIQGFHSLKSYGNIASYATGDSSGIILSIATSNSWGSGYLPETNKRAATTGVATGNKTLQIDDTTFSFDNEYFIFNGFNQSKGYIYSIWLEK